MSSIKRFALPTTAACISLVTFLFAGNSALALQLPGITPSGQPVFMNPVKVRYNAKNQTFKAWTNGSGRDFSLWDGSNLYAARGSLTLSASVDNLGNLMSPGTGTVQIKGGIAELGITGGGNVLMNANLSAFAFGNILNPDGTVAGAGFGFNTENIFCNPALPFICTERESVYLVLNGALPEDFLSSFAGSATAHTTVPVPAAVWLFGSAIALLGWVRRRASAVAG
jgi:hypothetical protein